MFTRVDAVRLALGAILESLHFTFDAKLFGPSYLSHIILKHESQIIFEYI